MPEGKWPGESYEARIERLAGASPRPCGCDFPKSGECGCDTSCAHCWPDFQDFPMPVPPPYTPPDDEGEADPMRFNTQQKMLDAQADDEGEAEPRD